MKYLPIVALFVSIVSAAGGHSGMMPIEEASEDKLALFRDYQGLIEAETGNQYNEIFEPISFSQQVVAGMNYSILYDIGNGQTLKVDVFQPLPYTNLPASIERVVESQPDSEA